MKLPTPYSFVLLLLSSLGSLAAAELQEYPSPQGSKRIRFESLGVVESLNEAYLQAELYQGKDKIWSYGGLARGFTFSWAPDTGGFFFEITHVTRSSTLAFVDLEPDGDVHLYSIDLDATQEQITAQLPPKHGNSAPKSRVDLDAAKWLSPTRCQVPFSQRFLGENADSILEIDISEPALPKVTIISVTPQ